jgi:SAM-dependent methyltransferase
MLPFALAIFCGAFLLFQVQPLIGKYLLPWFGGGPGVWTTCLLFFQLVLLGGYAYAHFLAKRLSPRRQFLVHGGLLVLAAVLLPIAPGEFWKAHIAGNPTFHILLLLSGTIGLPYFVLSATGPLVQQWFSLSRPTLSPYRLYALSNFGSLLALLSYPVWFEVHFERRAQAWFWSLAFVGFGAICAYCGWLASRAPAATATTADGAAQGSSAAELPRAALDRPLWVALPAVASVLLLATTNKLCQEIAVIPFLWVLPLSLYLLTFVICFDHARWYARGPVVALLTVAITVTFQIMPQGSSVPLGLQIGCYCATLFLACMFCHGELYRLKPPPRQLTSFYLSISAGGALGGLLVAVVAPAVFNDYHELPLGLWLLTYLGGVVCIRHASRTLAIATGVGLALVTVALPVVRAQFRDGLTFGDELLFLYRYYGWFIFGGLAIFVGCTLDGATKALSRSWLPRMGGFVMALSVVAGLCVIVQWQRSRGGDVVEASRNFYGTLKVYDYDADDPEGRYLELLHGATIHGIQFVADDKAMRHTTYYGETSGVGLALRHLPVEAGHRRIGLVGLGTGTLASYGVAGDYLRIYDINPAVERLARTRFTYLRRCPARIDVILGDARLSMEKEVAAGEAQQFDLLALDAFSSDAIPVHLLTREALAIYLKELKPEGVLAVHVSNRYLDLQPVVERLASEYALQCATISDEEHEWWVYPTTWILLTKNQALLETEDISSVSETPVGDASAKPLWTDDYASLYGILRKHL